MRKNAKKEGEEIISHDKNKDEKDKEIIIID